MPKKKFKWVVEFEVDEIWVGDGFDPDNDDMKQMLATRLPFADGSELKAKLLKRPSDTAIAKVQGYKNVSAYRAGCWRRGKSGVGGEKI